MGLLDRILAHKRAELQELRRLPLPEPPERRALDLRRHPAAGGARGPLQLIAEIKRRSPSAGQLSTRLSVTERAASYARSGASMLSVLCDREFFDGGFEHLREARAACDLPLLCKEFVIDERQLLVARAFGADAVLLIVRCLNRTEFGQLFERARELDLVPFVEVATPEEASLALDCGATLIGVNARDLDTLAIDRERARDVLGRLPDHVTKVHLSGVTSAAAVREMQDSPADAALIGEVLMRQDDPSELLAGLVAAARNSP
ncbi:MAG TPA: indole-3-glycerol phosphate synthase TrpC [Polyangiaceae bacterium]